MAAATASVAPDSAASAAPAIHATTSAAASPHAPPAVTVANTTALSYAVLRPSASVLPSRRSHQRTTAPAALAATAMPCHGWCHLHRRGT